MRRQFDSYSEALVNEQHDGPNTPPSTPSSLNSFFFMDEDDSHSGDETTTFEVYRVSHGAVDSWKVRPVQTRGWKVHDNPSKGERTVRDVESPCIGTTSDDRMSAFLKMVETPHDEGRLNRFSRGCGRARRITKMPLVTPGLGKLTCQQHPGGPRSADRRTAQHTELKQSRWSRVRDLLKGRRWKESGSDGRCGLA